MRNPKAVRRAMITLGENMQRRRKRLHLTQMDAAHRANMAWRHWQKCEAATCNACISTLVGIAAALETTLSELFAETRAVP